MKKIAYLTVVAVVMVLILAGCEKNSSSFSDGKSFDNEVKYNIQKNMNEENTSNSDKNIEIDFENGDETVEDKLNETENPVIPIQTQKLSEPLSEIETLPPSIEESDKPYIPITKTPEPIQTDAPKSEELPTETPVEIPTPLPTEVLDSTNSSETTEPPLVVEITPEPIKSIYDYEFNITDIRMELVSIGESMGLKHITENNGIPITPDNSSWALPVTASQKLQGKQLESSLKNYVKSMPDLIAMYGGDQLQYFTIYIEPLGGGSYKIYFLY